MSRSYVWRLMGLALMIGLLAVLAPAVGASPPAQTGPWTGWYYNGILDSNTCFNPPSTWSRTDPAISFYWQEGTSPWPGAIGTENYTVCWQGTFNFPSSGNYTFYTFHDDGIRVWVPDLSQPLMVDAWYDTGPFPNQGTWYVPAGWHKVVVAYYNHTNAGVACADWAPEGAPNPLNCPYFPPTAAPPPPPVPLPLPPPYSQTIINNIIANIIAQYVAPGGPYVVPGAPPVVRPVCFWYRVQWGDTLSGIAWKFGTTMWRLQQDNRIFNPNFIFVGQLLRICR
jgi:LysM domain-containing protein/PA14 domain-containing protein